MLLTESFWDFSVRTYRSEGVPQACLGLQNETGADVNVLLFCCWVGASRGEFQTAAYDAVMAFSHSWADNVVRPLRSVRTWMKIAGCPDPLLPKEKCMSLRERIKLVEFEAEQLQENVMQSMIDTSPPVAMCNTEQVQSAVLNLQRYCLTESISWDDKTQTRLIVILQAALPHAASIINFPLHPLGRPSSA